MDAEKILNGFGLWLCEAKEPDKLVEMRGGMRET